MCKNDAQAQRRLDSLGLEVEKLEILDDLQFELLEYYINFLELAKGIDATSHKTRERSRADQELRLPLQSLLEKEYDAFLSSFRVLANNKKYKDAIEEGNKVVRLVEKKLVENGIGKAQPDGKLSFPASPSIEGDVGNMTNIQSPKIKAGGGSGKRAVGKRRAEMIDKSDENPDTSDRRKRRRAENPQDPNYHPRHRRDDMENDHLPKVRARDFDTCYEVGARPLATSQTTNNAIREAKNSCLQEAQDAKPHCETEAQTLATCQDAEVVGDSIVDINDDHLQEARAIHTHCEIRARIMAASQTTGDAITYLDLISRCFLHAIRNDHVAYYLHLASLIQHVKPPIAMAELPENLKTRIGPLITVPLLGQEDPGSSKEARLQWLSNNIREASSNQHIKALQVEYDLEWLYKVHHDLLFDRIQSNTGDLKGLKDLKELEELDRVLGDRENTREATDMRTGEDSLFGSGDEEDDFKEPCRIFPDSTHESAKYDRHLEEQAGLQARIQILVKERDLARAERDKMKDSMEGKLEKMTRASQRTTKKFQRRKEIERQHTEVVKERDMLRRQIEGMEENAERQKKKTENELYQLQDKNAELIRELEIRQTEEGDRLKHRLSAPFQHPQSIGRGAATSPCGGADTFIQGENGCKPCGDLQHWNTKLSSALRARRKARVGRRRVPETKERKHIVPRTVDSSQRYNDSVTEELQKRLLVIESKNSTLREQNSVLNSHNAELANQIAKLTGKLNTAEGVTKRLKTCLEGIICFMSPDVMSGNSISQCTPSDLIKIVEKAFIEFVMTKNAITSSLGRAVQNLMCRRAHMLFQCEVSPGRLNVLERIPGEVNKFSKYDDDFIKSMESLDSETTALEETHVKKFQNSKHNLLAGLSVINLFLKASLRQPLERREDENICDTLRAASLWCSQMKRRLTFVLHDDKVVLKEYESILKKLTSEESPNSEGTMFSEYKQLFDALKDMTCQSKNHRDEIKNLRQKVTDVESLRQLVNATDRRLSRLNEERCDLLEKISRVWSRIREIQEMPQSIISVSSSAANSQLEDILRFLNSKDGPSYNCGLSQRVEYTNVDIQTDAPPCLCGLARANGTDCDKHAGEPKKPTRYEPIDCATQTDTFSCHYTDRAQQTDKPGMPIDCATQTDKHSCRNANQLQQTENLNKTMRDEPIHRATQTGQLEFNEINRVKRTEAPEKLTSNEAIDCATKTNKASCYNTDHAQGTVKSDRTINSATRTDHFSCLNTDRNQQADKPNEAVDCATQTGRSSCNDADRVQQNKWAREPTDNIAIGSATQTDEFSYLSTDHAQQLDKPNKPYRYTNHAQQTDKSLSHSQAEHRLLTRSSRAGFDDENTPKNGILNDGSPRDSLAYQGDTRPSALNYAQPQSSSMDHATPTCEEGSRADFAFEPLETKKDSDQNGPQCTEALMEVASNTLQAQVDDSASNECQGSRGSVPLKESLKVNGESWIVEDVRRLSRRQHIVTLSRGSESKSLTLREILDLDTAQEVDSNSCTLYSRFQRLFDKGHPVDMPQALLFKGVVNVFPAGRGWSCTVEYRNSKERHRVPASIVRNWGRHAQMALEEARSAFQPALPNRQTLDNPGESRSRACGCVHASECPETMHTANRG